ncbi:MAG: hypothetical protein OQJ97_11535 [Rhodospirillales bacterium]|nr:hypothetical protein [Rhodospirillales bacterium]
MELLYFTAAGIVAWVIANALLERIEEMAGRRFPYRSVIFFGLLLGMLLIVFEGSKYLLGANG